MSHRAGLVVITSSVLLLALVANQAGVAKGAPVSATSCVDTPVQCSISASDVQVGFVWPGAEARSGSLTTKVATVVGLESEVETLEPRNFFRSLGHAVSHITHAVTHPIASVAHAVTHPLSTIKHVAHAVTHPISTIKHAVHHVISTVHHAVRTVGHTVRHIAHTVKHTVRHIAHTVRHAVRTVGHVVRETAHFIKTNGPTIAKIGLKMLASSQGILSTVAKVIPGAGIPLSKGLKMGAKGLDMASGMIHANVPKGWSTAMQVMDFAEDPIGNGLKKAGLHGAVGAAAGMILG